MQVLDEELLGTKSQMEAEQKNMSALETRLAELEVGFLLGCCPEQPHLLLFNWYF